MPHVQMLLFLIFTQMFKTNHFKNSSSVLIKGLHLLDDSILGVTVGAGADVRHPVSVHALVGGGAVVSLSYDMVIQELFKRNVSKILRMLSKNFMLICRYKSFKRVTHCKERY